MRSGPLIRAIINPTREDVEIKFRNLDEWHAFYPAGAQPALQRLLLARHIRVLFVARHHHAKPSRSMTVHHHLRYIAAGVLALLAALGAAALMYSRRRRQQGTTGAEAGQV